MDSIIQEAFVTMLVGMTTVFLILLLVVLSAKFLIRILNVTGFVLNPEDKKSGLTHQNKIEHDKILEQAIAQWSKGKAKIRSIKKI